MRGALVAFVALAGCAALGGEGEESLVVSNQSGQPISVIVRLVQDEGAFVVFADDSFYDVGATREFVLSLRPGGHTMDVTTTNRLQERLVVDVPSRGDTRMDLVVEPRAATLSVTGR